MTCVTSPTVSRLVWACSRHGVAFAYDLERTLAMFIFFSPLTGSPNSILIANRTLTSSLRYTLSSSTRRANPAKETKYHARKMPRKTMGVAKSWRRMRMNRSRTNRKVKKR